MPLTDEQRDRLRDTFYAREGRIPLRERNGLPVDSQAWLAGLLTLPDEAGLGAVATLHDLVDLIREVTAAYLTILAPVVQAGWARGCATVGDLAVLLGAADGPALLAAVGFDAAGHDPRAVAQVARWLERELAAGAAPLAC